MLLTSPDRHPCVLFLAAYRKCSRVPRDTYYRRFIIRPHLNFDILPSLSLFGSYSQAYRIPVRAAIMYTLTHVLQSILMQINARCLLRAKANAKNPSDTSCLGIDISPDTGVCLAFIHSLQDGGSEPTCSQ